MPQSTRISCKTKYFTLLFSFSVIETHNRDSSLSITDNRRSLAVTSIELLIGMHRARSFPELKYSTQSFIHFGLCWTSIELRNEPGFLGFGFNTSLT